MKVSNMLLATLREAPAEAETKVHQLLMRAGLIRKIASGVYNYLPLGLRVLRKIQYIIKQEMDMMGGQEVWAPVLLPAELCKEHCWQDQDETFTLRDRSKRSYCLEAAHEEVLTDMIKSDLRSYKILPVFVYQIQSKFRDERRPRYGTLRSRAFTTMDICSYDQNEEGLDKSYNKMYQAFTNIFDRYGIKCNVAEGEREDGGNVLSHEFVVMSELGDTEIACCSKCGYMANAEKSPCLPDDAGDEELKDIKKVSTPDARTIEDLIRFFNTEPSRFAKTLIYKAPGKVIAAMVRGDRELNMFKLARLLNLPSLEMADSETVEKATHAEVGFAGPVGIDVDMLIVDEEVASMKNIIVGANDTGYHLINVNHERDFEADVIADVRLIVDGDRCPKCKEAVNIKNAVKIGSVSRLGSECSKAMNAYYVNENGEEKPFVMGSYTAGIDRIMAALIEQNNDEYGIVWPLAAAPYHVIIITAVASNEEQRKASEGIYGKLKGMGVEVLLDDRDERAGVKFKDADLIGIPIRITVGKKTGQGIVEFKLRSEKAVEEIKIDEVYNKVMEQLDKAGIKTV